MNKNNKRLLWGFMKSLLGFTLLFVSLNNKASGVSGSMTDFLFVISGYLALSGIGKLISVYNDELDQKETIT